jgi:hypothetical protein
VPVRDAPHGLAIEHLAIRRVERGRVPDGELLLPVPQLGVVLLDLDVLGLERRHELVHERRGGRHPGRGEAEAFVERREAAVGLADGQRELAFERRAHAEARGGARGDLTLEERARARVPRRAVQRAHVGRHRRRVRCVREHGERARVGHEPDLADGTEAFDRLELVEHVHGLHRDRESDAVGDTAAQALDVGGLGACHAAVVRIKEANETDARPPCACDHSLIAGLGHRGRRIAECSSSSSC